jgi:hypothetical protein
LLFTVKYGKNNDLELFDAMRQKILDKHAAARYILPRSDAAERQNRFKVRQPGAEGRHQRRGKRQGGSEQ